MAWDGMERRKGIEAEVTGIVSELKQTVSHHIASDDTKFSLMIEKLHELDTSVARLIVLNTETLKSQMNLISSTQTMVLEHNKLIFGNGSGDKGIAVRIDRLESSEEARKWTFRVMWTAIIGILAKVFYDLIRRG